MNWSVGSGRNNLSLGKSIPSADPAPVDAKKKGWMNVDEQPGSRRVGVKIGVIERFCIAK